MDISRRDFLKATFVGGSGLVIAVYLAGCKRLPGGSEATDVPGAGDSLSFAAGTPGSETILGETGAAPMVEEISAVEPPAELVPNIFVKIGADGLVTIISHRSEMGQGVRTALPMIVADELGANWNDVGVEQGLADTAYGSQGTGGSLSVQTCFTMLRKAGALGRQILINAAAQTWGLEASDCYAENSLVIHRPSGQQLSFGPLVGLASTLPLPPASQVSLKDPAEFKIIGTSKGRVDNADILTGKAVFGMDVRLPGMLYAAVARCPVIGGKAASYDDTAARQVPGVREVVQIDNGIAVVAEQTYQALRAKALLKVTWDPGANASLNSADLEQELLDRANFTPPAEGEFVQNYIVPYFAHATMEPMNCTSDVKADGCELWVPTQNSQLVLTNVAFSVLKTSPDKVKVHVPLIGGAFGRRLEEGPAGLPVSVDYVREAVQISQAVQAPVHLVWTRQDDFGHDMYHPLSVTQVKARGDQIKTLTMRRLEVSASIPVGYWRSVTNIPEAFAHESFVDEFALETGVDPVELRRSFLSPRAQAVVDMAAEMAGWGSPMPAGSARGIAYHAAWGVTHVAQVAEVTLSGNEIRVPRVFCAVDCGLVINPDMVVAQMESGIIFGMTAALKEFMPIENGAAMRTSFRDYPILRFDEIPQVEVQIVLSSEAPTGIGEMGNPPTAPAIANAVFALTGQRLRRLPLRLV
jgi:isoquinoline 1-oxidoreductase beta subunit